LAVTNDAATFRWPRSPWTAEEGTASAAADSAEVVAASPPIPVIKVDDDAILFTINKRILPIP
jgi:hypothetical protein